MFSLYLFIQLKVSFRLKCLFQERPGPVGRIKRWNVLHVAAWQVWRIYYLKSPPTITKVEYTLWDTCNDTFHYFKGSILTSPNSILIFYVIVMNALWGKFVSQDVNTYYSRSYEPNRLTAHNTFQQSIIVQAGLKIAALFFCALFRQSQCQNNSSWAIMY